MPSQPHHSRHHRSLIDLFEITIDARLRIVFRQVAHEERQTSSTEVLLREEMMAICHVRVPETERHVEHESWRREDTQKREQR